VIPDTKFLDKSLLQHFGRDRLDFPIFTKTLLDPYCLYNQDVMLLAEQPAMLEHHFLVKEHSNLKIGQNPHFHSNKER
jgi:hypothetical protein